MLGEFAAGVFLKERLSANSLVAETYKKVYL
jgi:hypothetical protein